MKVKMLEYYQGHRNKGIFAPDEEREVDEALGEYLVKHGKAVEIVEKKPKPKANPVKKVKK